VPAVAPPEIFPVDAVVLLPVVLDVDAGADSLPRLNGHQLEPDSAAIAGQQLHATSIVPTSARIE
jgi:hypothetical protein